MTLDTTVSTTGPVNVEDLRMFCGQQLGVVEGWFCEPSDVLPGYVLLTPHERFVGGAHLSILYVPDGENGRDVEVCWITGWGSRPVEFHRRLAEELSSWFRDRQLECSTARLW